MYKENIGYLIDVIKEINEKKNYLLEKISKEKKNYYFDFGWSN